MRELTIDDYESALDLLAEGMAEIGNEAVVYLPIYERLERKLEEMRNADDKLAAIRARVKRSKDRKAAQPAA